MKVGEKIKFMYSSYNKCAVVDTRNTIYIWGHNFQGFWVRHPTEFYQFEDKHILKWIEFGEKHGLALTEAGKIFAWGDGTYGELGDPSICLSEIPRWISFFHDQNIKVKTMSCGIRHSVVIDSEGKIYTFGDNSNSQCGLKIPRSEIPRKHETTFKSIAVFSGQTHNYVKSD